MRSYAGSELGSILSDTEKAAWNAPKSVHTNFLGNHKAENFREIVIEMFPSYEALRVTKATYSVFSSGLFPSELWEKLAMNTVEGFTKIFPSWKNGLWEDGSVVCVRNTVGLW